MDDCLDSVGGSKWFTTLDANTGYWKINVDTADKENTAFYNASWDLSVLAYALRVEKCPRTFQRALDRILSGVVLSRLSG
jgi:hypothetical protein